MIYLDVTSKIEKLRKKLYDSIDKNGLNSDNTRNISKKLDVLVNEYYNKPKKYDEDNDLLIAYNKSIKALKQLTVDLRRFSKYKNLDGIC